MADIIVIPPPKPMRHAMGMRVRATRDIHTSVMTIPTGRLGVVDHSSGVKVSIQFAPCELLWRRPSLHMEAERLPVVASRSARRVRDGKG